MKFKWFSQDPNAAPTSGEVNLGLAGNLQGGKFLMIFEDPNYTGDPIASSFPGNTAGLKVKDGFFQATVLTQVFQRASMAHTTAPTSSSRLFIRTS